MTKQEYKDMLGGVMTQFTEQVATQVKNLIMEEIKSNFPPTTGQLAIEAEHQVSDLV